MSIRFCCLLSGVFLFIHTLPVQADGVDSLSVSGFISNRGEGVEMNYNHGLNIGAAVYQLDESNTDKRSVRLNIGYGFPIFQFGAVLVSEPLESPQSIGDGAGVRLFFSYPMTRKLALSGHAITLFGNERNKTDFGVHLQYTFGEWPQ